MISSEVQRTLVKSPPELWAELSDPDALSRHLGALGDVRITRAEPEKLVEWEAQGTSGSVQIKPSAWGTKVTLCVTRELDAAPPPPDPGAADEAAATHAQEPAAPDEPATEPLATPEPEGAETVEAAEPVLSGLDEAVAVDAHEPMAVDAHEPIAADFEEAVIADAEAPVAAESEAPMAADAQEPMVANAEEAPTTEADEQKTIAFMAVAEPEIADDSRRGFFARLFDRLWARTDDGSPRLPAEATRHLDLKPHAAPAGADDGGEFSPEADVAEDETGVASTAIESLQARFAREDASPDEPEEAIEAIDVVSEQTIEPTAVESQPEAAEHAGTAAESPPEEAAEDPPEPGAAPSTDLATELKAAEEVAAEEVTAMLTAVLDRLGAAHHRPFSRS
jgi:hypothetical protein